MEDTETDPKKKGGKVEISSMPNCYRHTLPSMMREIDEAVRLNQNPIDSCDMLIAMVLVLWSYFQ